MTRSLRAAPFMLVCLALTATGQDWYRDRATRYQGEHWRSHVFQHVKIDLDHIGSAAWASGRERTRLERTEQELTELQGKLENGRYDEHELSDVIASLKKSVNDHRLEGRDREVLNDDLNRLGDYRQHHDHWNN